MAPENPESLADADRASTQLPIIDRVKHDSTVGLAGGPAPGP
jgi:hypothetical protein